MSLKQHPEDQLITVFASHNFDAESEAETVQSLLRSADLESLIVRENVVELPTGNVEVRVLADVAEEARRVIDEAAREGSGEG